MAARRITAALLALLLGACNQVISDEPWFAATDAEGAPRLRDGLWVSSAQGDDCRFKETTPVEKWPECADALFIRDNEWLGLTRKADKGRKAWKWERLPALIANGDPSILQYKNPATDKDGDANGPEFYAYMGIRPTLRDEAGKVTAFEYWPVQCGPMDEDDRSSQSAEEDGEVPSGTYVTNQPFPGLAIQDDHSCTAESQQALRNAAKQSQGLGAGPLPNFHWVRDGWR